MDFLTILTFAVSFTGIIWFLDKLFWAPKRKGLFKRDTKTPVIIDYARSLFPVLLLILVVRAFVVQPWRVPTGSLEPTVLPGDFIIVSQFAYGLRLPVINKKIFSVSQPEVGDLAVFRWPVDPSIFYVKRVIGTPGDHIVYKNKVLTVNGREASQEILGEGMDVDRPHLTRLIEKQETLNGIKHRILIDPFGGLVNNFDIKVPEGYYFMMGDNRDASLDSRAWGFVPEQNLVGRPFGIILSWDQHERRLRWDRFARTVQ